MPSAQASDRRGAAQPARSAVWPERGSRKSRSRPKCRVSRAAARAVPTVSLGCTQAPQWRVPKARTTSAEAGSRPRKGYRQSTKKAASPEVAFSIRCDHVRSCSILCFAGRRPVALCCCLAGREGPRRLSPSGKIDDCATPYFCSPSPRGIGWQTKGDASVWATPRSSDT